MAGRLEVRTRLRNALVHYWHEGILVYSSKNRVYGIDDLDRPRPQLIAEVPWSARQRLSHVRILDRVLKNGILQVHRSSRGEMLIMTGHRWWRRSADGQVSEVRPPSPTRPMNRGYCESATGVTYVCDYLANPDRRPVRIYRSRDLTSFEPCWEFDAGVVRHVHALIPDEQSPDRIWILTGDDDPESSLYYTDDGFSSVHRHLNIGQASRACDLRTDDGRLLWGMDSPDETSFILCQPKGADGAVDRLFELPGPAYYAGCNGAGAAYFGTTWEPGKAVKDNCAHIIGSRPDGGWDDVHQARTDRIPQHGIFYFPRGRLPDNWLVFSQRALVPHEGCMTLARDTAWA